MKRQNIAKSIVVQLLLVNMILILGCPSKPNVKKADDNSPKNFYEMTEEKIYALANELNEDPDVLLALSGKVSQDIQEIIRKRPQIFAQLIRELKDMPDHAVLRIVREVRDGNW